MLVNKVGPALYRLMISELQDALTGAVEKAAISTVSVSTSARPYRGWGRFPSHGAGSGVVMDAKGHVLTNYHVVKGAERILVSLSDGSIVGGRVLGGDEETDIAVVKVDDETTLQPAEFGDSDALKVGQPVLAIGNPLGLAGGPAVTSGVVSSLRRSLQVGNGNGLKMIQTDAAVNPGNSGGPLVDLEGKVIAVNTANIPHADGIGFAVPAKTALATAEQIIEHGRVQRPWVGIVGYDVNRRVARHYGLKATRGVLVAEITAGGPAESAGLRVGDVILSLGGESLDSVGDLVDALRARKIEEKIEMEVDRNGQSLRIEATLGTRPF
ncbi:MAG: trypsin-like peptidase domain-containing protein [Thermoplasmata archaeon]